MSPDPTSLDRLHDIVAPPPVPWWPPAPGWCWVIGLLGALFLLALAFGFRAWQRNRYRREALAELCRVEKMLTDPAGRAEAISTAAALLKRAALSTWSRREVASLTGSAWNRFLDRTGGTSDFTTGAGRLLERWATDPRAAAQVRADEAQDALAAAKCWLKRHQREEIVPC